LSRAEEITSEVRKLVLTCRSLEAQLQQSVPKKAHEESIAKLQTTIDSLNGELSRVKSELENTTSLGQRISTLEAQIASQGEVISSQGHTFEAISSKLVENSVPFALYTETLEKVQALEAKISSMVDFNEYNVVKQNCAELQAQVANMVPRSAFEELRIELANSVPSQKYEELRSSFDQMVPREQFNVAEARVAELERTLADSVPRHDFEELAARIAQFTKEASQLTSVAQIAVTPVSVPDSSSSQVPAASAETAKQDEPAFPAPVEVVNTSSLVAEMTIEINTPEPTPAPVEEVRVQVENNVQTVESPAAVVVASQEVAPFTTPAETGSSPENTMATSAPETTTPPPAQVDVQPVEIVAPEPATSEVPRITEAPPSPVEAPPQEITEVQSNLSEISSAIETGATSMPAATEQTPVSVVVDSEKGFRFSNTGFCARSGMEFLEDVEKVDISVIVGHTQSGDFERWFKEVLSDETSAQSLKSIRESNVAGEDLRTMLVAAIAPRYRA
jgi:hypothetical protein